MECHCHKLSNSLIEICLGVGMDQDTGLVPASSPGKRQQSKGNNPDSHLYSIMFETNVLAAMSAETVSFPHAPYDCIRNGEPYYPTYGIMFSPNKGGHPTRRRRGSVMLCRAKTAETAELPLGQDVINSLPPLCFPDGGYVSQKKKPAVCHSLVLTDIEGNRSYCICMTFYRGFIVKKDDAIPGNYKLLYFDEKADRTAFQGSTLSVCYVPTCCCLISKWPYFNLMKDCLSCVLPKLMTTDASGFRRALMQFVSQLTMVPVPPAGSLGIAFDLYGVRHVVRPAEDTETRVIDMDLRYPFLYFSLDDILLLIGCILTQQRIVFLSSSYSLLTPVIESLFTFIQPFSWSWTYVPILPSALLDLVEAPGAFIMGCHAQHKKQIQRVVDTMDELSGIVIADIDEGTVALHPDANVPRLPSFAVAMYKFRMKNAKIFFDSHLLQRETFFSIEELKREREQFVRNFQQLVLATTLEMMLRMFSDIKNFIVQQEELFFDMDSFIQSKPQEDQDFYRVVCKSHAFSTFLYDLIHGPEKTDYFTLKAQQTKVPHRVVPIRKRSSSSTTFHVISDEFFVNPQDELDIFVLPPFSFEGVYTGRFYEDYLKSLNTKISDLMNKSSSLLANYLYLRGTLRVACGQNVKAVDDFFGVSSRNVQLFPTKTVQEILCKLKDEEKGELKTSLFWRKAEQLLQAKEKVESRPERKEVVTSSIPSTPLELTDFEKHVSRLQIANSKDAGKRLFGVLRNSRKEEKTVVEPEAFAQFFEALTEASNKARSLSLPGVSLSENEYVLKISQMIKTNEGVGFLVLTVERLLFLENGTQHCTCEIAIKDIEKVEIITYSETILTRGVTAVKITSGHCIDLPPMVFLASLKEENELWLRCLLEMKAGYKIADALMDPDVKEHAAQNVIMVDALRLSDYPDDSSFHVLNFSTQEGFKNKLSDNTRKTLLQRVRPSPQDMEKTTVEALLYVPGSKESNPKLWCAMGPGVIVVIDARPTLDYKAPLAWGYETHMKHAKDRVSCLLAVGNHVWAGSLDTTIYVINTHTKNADQQLLGHRDSLSHMIQTQDKQGHTTVWSASSNGQIIGWDPVTLIAKKELQVKVGKKDEKTLHWFCAVGETFWCATKFSVYVTTYSKDHEDTRVLTPKKDEQMSIDCMCAVSDTQVWTACNREGYIVVWNTCTYENQHYKDICKCRGFTNMMRVGQKVWAGSKIGTIYVLNAKTVQLEMDLLLHEDLVRAMCLTDFGHVVTGPGSRDGRLAVWKSHFYQTDSGRAKPKVEQKRDLTDEDCGFEVVPKQSIVKYDVDRDTCCYIPGGSG